MSEEFEKEIERLAAEIDELTGDEDLRVTIAAFMVVLARDIVELFDNEDRNYIRKQFEIVVAGLRGAVEGEMNAQGIAQETRQ